MPNKNIRRGPPAGGAPSDFTNRSVANDIYVDAVTNALTYGTGASGTATAIVQATGIAIAPFIISADGAIPIVNGTYVITKGSAAALTLAAPTAAQAGTELIITSRTAFAHVITATGLLNTGSANVNVATYAAFAGASVTLVADNLKWNVIAQIGITFT